MRLARPSPRADAKPFTFATKRTQPLPSLSAVQPCAPKCLAYSPRAHSSLASQSLKYKAATSAIPRCHPRGLSPSPIAFPRSVHPCHGTFRRRRRFRREGTKPCLTRPRCHRFAQVLPPRAVPYALRSSLTHTSTESAAHHCARSPPSHNGCPESGQRVRRARPTEALVRAPRRRCQGADA